MCKIDFSQKISVQRPFGKKVVVKDKYGLIRQFESDRGRVINSPMIRRLQQKTQVFPLERNAAVRSRLTHSLEVQQVGRHIIKAIIEQLDKQGLTEQYGLTDYLTPIESMIEMACLLHDVGNPPFGHFGEDAINRWFCRQLSPNFSEHSGGNDPCMIETLRLQGDDMGLNSLRRRVRRDLCQFEGNAQAIRLVHTLQKLNLTYSQVACILKYTKPAYWTGDLPNDHSYLMKKPGFYLSEEIFIRRLRKELKMGEYNRYPLTYIMEAADDISYCIADLEDAVEKGIMTVKQLYTYLLKEWGEHVSGDLFDKTVAQAYREMQKRSDRRSESDQFFMYLRVYTITELVPYTAGRFIDHLPELFHGEWNQALLENSGPQSKLLNVLKQVAMRYVFSDPEVELLELQGDRVISGLLNIYGRLLDIPLCDFRQLVGDNTHRRYPIETRLWHKLATKQRLAYEEAVSAKERNLLAEQPDYFAVWEYYFRARLIQDYISGMTDLYAYDEYRCLMVSE